MNSTEAWSWFFYGCASVTCLTAFIGSGHLWKPKFFKLCVGAATSSFVVGVVLEFTNFLEKDRGLTIVVMSVPLIYLAYFYVLRRIFVSRTGGEPYVTDRQSHIGGTPLDLFASEGKDGMKMKFEPNRKISGSDFVFSFLQALLPIGTIFFLIALVRYFNGK